MLGEVRRGSKFVRIGLRDSAFGPNAEFRAPNSESNHWPLTTNHFRHLVMWTRRRNLKQLPHCRPSVSTVELNGHEPGVAPQLSRKIGGNDVLVDRAKQRRPRAGSLQRLLDRHPTQLPRRFVFPWTLMERRAADHILIVIERCKVNGKRLGIPIEARSIERQIGP